MDVAHTRLTNLRTLIKRAGSQSAFARAVDTAPSYISQIIKRVRLPSGKERNVGDDFARSIETALNLPHGWMDVPQTEMPYDPNPEQVQPNHDVWQQGQAAEVRELGMGRLRARHTQDVTKIDREIQIPFLDSRASMGNGTPLTDYVNVVEMVAANRDELAKRCTFTSPANLRLLTAYGNSMSPTFSDGDVLLVDTGVTTLTVDQVYVLQRDDELFIKRITRHPVDRSLFVMSSDNKEHPPFEIRPDRDGFQVLATVVSVWNFRKL